LANFLEESFMITIHIIFFILIVLPFLVGLIFFLRFLFQKKNQDCGLFGLFVMIIIGLFAYFFFDIINYEPKEDFISGFENSTGLSYPASGKIIKRKKEEGFNFFGGYRKEAIIEMDSFDYEILLRGVRLSRYFKLDSINLEELQQYPSNYSPTINLKKQIPAVDFDYVYECTGRIETSLWFHKNKQTIYYREEKK